VAKKLLREVRALLREVWNTTGNYVRKQLKKEQQQLPSLLSDVVQYWSIVKVLIIAAF
jgi:hypothetical protein